MATKIGAQGQKALARVATNAALLSLKKMPVTALKEWEDNPRRNDAAAPKLAELLQEQGQRTPIVFWPKNGVVYKGNTTLKAAKLLGWTELWTIPTDFPSEQAAIAYGIADNKSSEFSEWDMDILGKLMKADQGFFNRANTGFTEKELSGIMMAVDMPEGLEPTDMMGDSAAQGEFLVLQFTESGDLERFREWMGMGKQERTILFTDMVKTMGLEW